MTVQDEIDRLRRRADFLTGLLAEFPDLEPYGDGEYSSAHANGNVTNVYFENRYGLGPPGSLRAFFFMVKDAGPSDAWVYSNPPSVQVAASAIGEWDANWRDRVRDAVGERAVDLVEIYLDLQRIEYRDS